MFQLNLKDSLGIRVFLIAFIILVLLIPVLRIQSLIRERQIRRNQAVLEVSDKWGDRQVLTGPVLNLPYRTWIEDGEGIRREEIEYIHFLPEELNVQGSLQPTVRYRGIYEVILYSSDLEISGHFPALDLAATGIHEDRVIRRDADLSFGIRDMKGIRDVIRIQWDDAEQEANPGVSRTDAFSSGIQTRIPLDRPDRPHPFSMKLRLNGSESLGFIPAGKITNVRLNSEWSNPSFTGAFLPETREIGQEGFSATWKILHLNRNFPQVWTGEQHSLSESVFGVKLLMRVDEYQKNMRTSKYAILFIGLTFLALFIIELLSGKAVHPVQYLLVGLGLALFYSLLLSLSEQIRFPYAYGIASLGMILLITCYAKSVFRENRLVFWVSGILALLYIYFYVILQLQDLALLIGSLGLFLILAVVMFLTKGVDWFEAFKTR
ncbi:cell envelope integrity protein CreD [bacterium]|nr:cell envelope integrity protein CreD [bacterium]